MSSPANAARAARRCRSGAGECAARSSLALLLAALGAGGRAGCRRRRRRRAGGVGRARRLPRRRHPQRRPLRHAAAPARPGASAGRQHPDPLRRRAGDGAAQVSRPGVPPRRRPGPERDRRRRVDDAAVQPAQQPARHRLRRPARHRRLGAAGVPGRRARVARRAVRSRSPVPPRRRVQGAAAEAAVHQERERPRPLHDLDRGAGPRRGAARARRRAHRPGRRLVRDAGRARVPAPVPEGGAAQRARRRRAARHGAAGELLARQPGRLRCPRSPPAPPSRRARATIPTCSGASRRCCSRCRARSRRRIR